MIMVVHGNNTYKDGNVILLGSERFRTTKLINEEVLVQIRNETEIKKEEIIVGTKRLGFYVLPFIGFHNSQGLEWKSVGGDFEIEENDGVSWGIRVGHEWKYAFTDIQFSGFKNTLENVDVGLTSLDFSGDSSGFGGYFSGGGRFNFNEFFSGNLGGGVGFIQHDISLSIMGLPVEDEDFLFSYHFFSGLEFRPVEYFLLGFRYRWSKIGKMKLFSSKQIQAVELTMGHLF